jgi:plastocyanin
MRGAMIRGGLVAAVATAALVGPWTVPAGAGGGCHKPLSTGQGATVTMAEACFTPSILRVDPGTEVRFVNKDAITHNVSANGWSSMEDMSQSDDFLMTFSEPGVYPFACTYHPGMVGAVVVGDGLDAGSGASGMGATTLAQNDPTNEGQTALASTRSDSAASPTGWVAGGAIGLALGAGASLVWRRRGRKDPAAG